MKPGDIVRVKPSSIWYEVVGDAEGEVQSVVEHTRFAWVRFHTIGLTAERWRWEEFTIVGTSRCEAQARAESGGRR